MKIKWAQLLENCESLLFSKITKINKMCLNKKETEKMRKKKLEESSFFMVTNK